MPNPVITTSDLSHAYGRVVALHHVGLDVPPGRIGLVGANGAGKTTLIKILLGILTPTLGRASVFGHDVRRDVLSVRAKVGYMPEGDCLPLSQTAADFLVLAAQLAGLPTRPARQRASDVLTLVGLDEARFRYLGEFSTGMKQRAKLAQAIVHDPEIVFLDEPTAGLDPEGREEMLQLVERLRGFGINVLISTHLLADVERTCEWVVMLDGGKVLRAGPLASLVDEQTVVVEVLGDPNLVSATLTERGAQVAVNRQTLSVSSSEHDAFDLIRDALAHTGMGMRRLDVRSTSLEEIFLGEEETAP